MMQAIGRRYVGCFNARYGRTGTLWEGSFKSALVDSERYVLTCYRYIELNPVRAAMVGSPGAYRWSSHARNAHGSHEPRITPHPTYLQLGSDDTSAKALIATCLRTTSPRRIWKAFDCTLISRKPGEATDCKSRSRH